VIDEIHNVGGRFLKEQSDGSWTEVIHARAVEKTCQALREKEKANPPPNSPFVGEDTPPSKRPKLGPPKRKAQARRPATPDSEEDGSIVSGSSMTDSEEEEEKDASTSSEETDTESGVDKVASGPIQMKTWSQNELLVRLEKFRATRGHCAVPPNFEDHALADWCCAQRQLHREIESNYRPVTEQEQRLLHRLKEMDFCWDYEEWHWNRRLQELQSTTSSQRENNNVGRDDLIKEEHKLPSPETLEWLQDQRHKYHTEGHWLVPTWRIEKLKALGISL